MILVVVLEYFGSCIVMVYGIVFEIENGTMVRLCEYIPTVCSTVHIFLLYIYIHNCIMFMCIGRAEPLH